MNKIKETKSSRKRTECEKSIDKKYTKNEDDNIKHNLAMQNLKKKKRNSTKKNNSSPVVTPLNLQNLKRNQNREGWEEIRVLHKKKMKRI